MKIKILYVVRPVQGGIKRHLQDLLTYIDRGRYHLTVVCPDDNESVQEWAKYADEVIGLPLRGCCNPYYDWHFIQKLRQVIIKKEIQLIHFHGAKAALLGRIAVLLNFPFNFFNLYNNPSVIVTVHNSLFEKHSIWIRSLKGRILGFVDRLFTHRFITVSKSLKQELIQWEHIDPEKITFIYNGINFNALELINKKERLILKLSLGLGRFTPVVGTVCRLVPEKGIDYFLQAASLIKEIDPETSFLIVGDGPSMNDLKSLAKQLGLENKVIFTGYRSDIIHLLSIMDLVVVPSLSEGFGFSALEAMALGQPVVASKVGGLKELIKTGYTGYLVPPGDYLSLAEIILEILNNPAKAAWIGHNALRVVRHRFSIDRMVKQTEQVYEKEIQRFGLAEDLEEEYNYSY